MVNKEMINEYVNRINDMNEHVVELSKDRITFEEVKNNITINLLRELYKNLNNDGVILSLLSDTKKLLFENNVVEIYFDDNDLCNLIVRKKADNKIYGKICQYSKIDNVIMQLGEEKSERIIHLEKLNEGCQVVCKYTGVPDNTLRRIGFEDNGIVKWVVDHRRIEAYYELGMPVNIQENEVIIHNNLNVTANYSNGAEGLVYRTNSPRKLAQIDSVDKLLQYYVYNKYTPINKAHLKYFPELESAMMQRLNKKEILDSEEYAGRKIL